MKTEKTKTKHAKYMQALVAAFGEGTVQRRKDVVAVWAKNPDEYPHLVTITKNLDYRVGRGRYVITASETPAVERDKAIANLKNVEATKLPAKVRKDATKLAKAVATKPAKAPKTVAATPAPNLPVMEDDEAGDEDINTILRTIQN